MDMRYWLLLVVIELLIACFIPMALACRESDKAWLPLERKIIRRNDDSPRRPAYQAPGGRRPLSTRRTKTFDHCNAICEKGYDG